MKEIQRPSHEEKHLNKTFGETSPIAEPKKNLLGENILDIANVTKQTPTVVRKETKENLPSDEVSIIDTDNQKAKALCKQLKQENNLFLGAYQFGTPGGADLDLRLCFETLPPLEEQEAIQQKFRELHLDSEVDILFMRKQELAEGKIDDITEFAKAEQHLKYGFDPHYEQAAVGDTSLFSAYIFGTMQKFYEDSTQPLVSPDIARTNIALSKEGAIGWTHYYTGCFLGEYNNYKQHEDLKSAGYQKRLAKFFSRVTLGSTLAQLDANQLKSIQPELMEAIKSSDKTISSDERMIDVMLHNPYTKKLISEDTKELLQQAGKIRSGDVAFDQTFIDDSESSLFYNAYLQGIERRVAKEQPIDYLTGYAFETLVRDFGELKEFNAGDKLTVQNAKNEQEVFYLPLREKNEKVKIEINDSNRLGSDELVQRQRVAGSLVGEGPIFNLSHRSATTTIQEDGTKIWVMNAEKIKNMLASPEMFKQLQETVLQDKNARASDVLLQYFSREAGRFVRETQAYTFVPQTEEHHEYLTKDNPLSQYYLKDGFHDILETFVDQPEHQVKKISSEAEKSRVLFKENEQNDKLFVVSKGHVNIQLKTGEKITMKKGMVFGESSLLGGLTTGNATLSENGSVLAIDAKNFQEFTQSRHPIANLPPDVLDKLPSRFKDKKILPRHLLYHLSAVGYGRVRQRLKRQIN